MQHSAHNGDSAAFGNVPKDSEDFRSVPKHAERKENHILTVHIAARMFEDAGVARTERSITNWCQPDKNGVSRLDCYFDTNERKYFITPQSVERAIEEEKSKVNSVEFPNAAEAFGNIQNTSETYGKVSHSLEGKPPVSTSYQQSEPARLPPDLLHELEELRVEKRVWSRERKFIEEWVTKLEKEREAFVPQLVEQSRTIGYLEYKSERLERENQQLLSSPRQEPPRVIEQQSSNASDSEDEPEGEMYNIVTGSHL